MSVVDGATGWVLDAVWHLGQAPAWMGWSLLTGGLCAVSWLAGSRR